MVSDRNRQIVERHRSGESFSAIGSAFGISRERVRQIVEREERREQRARELEEAARLPQQPNPLQLPPRLRNMLAELFGTPDFTPDDVAALEYSVRCSGRSQILDRGIGKSLTATAGYDSVGRGAMPSKVCYRRQPGKHLLFASISHFDP
jgi:hypothetical protein